MKISALAILAFGLFVFVGGIIGYEKAGSLPSLIAGSVSALLLIACSLGLFRDSILAYYSSIVILSLLTLFFIYRFVITSSFMPAGMMAILSIAMLGFMFFMNKKQVKHI